MQPPKISLESLLSITSQIESARWNNYGPQKVEFQWLYQPGKSLELLERATDDYLLSIFQLVGSTSAFVLPENMNALACVHNHPSGIMLPSYTDIVGFLMSVSKSDTLQYEIIADTSREKVAGFYVLEFVGDRSKATKMSDKISKLHSERCKVRQKEIRLEPHRFPHIMVGSNIRTPEEKIQFSIEVMKSNQINHFEVALPGYKFQDWEFSPL